MLEILPSVYFIMGAVYSVEAVTIIIILVISYYLNFIDFHVVI